MTKREGAGMSKPLMWGREELENEFLRPCRTGFPAGSPWGAFFLERAVTETL